MKRPNQIAFLLQDPAPLGRFTGLRRTFFTPIGSGSLSRRTSSVVSVPLPHPMTIARLLVLLLLTLPLLHADPLGPHLTVTPVEGWSSVAPGFKGPPPPFPTLSYAPSNGAKVRLLMTVLPNTADKTGDRAWLRDLHRLGCRYFLPNPESPVRAVDFQFRNGFGLYSTFEDPEHVAGKVPAADAYRFATVIALAPRGGDAVQTTIFSDNVSSLEYQQAMQIVRSLTVRSPAPTRPTATGKAVVDQEEVTVSGLDAVLRIPAGEFKPGAALNEHPGYFSLVHQSGLILSGWLDNKADYPGFRTFWAREKQKLEANLGVPLENEETKLIGGWQVVRYTMTIGNIVQANLRACRVTGGTWADLHLSRTGGNKPDWESLEAMLKSITLVRRDSTPPN